MYVKVSKDSGGMNQALDPGGTLTLNPTQGVYWEVM